MREIRFTGEQLLTKYLDRLNNEFSLYRKNERTFEQSKVLVYAIDMQLENMIYALKDFYLISEEQVDELLKEKKEIYKRTLNRMSITKEVRDNYDVC